MSWLLRSTKSKLLSSSSSLSRTFPSLSRSGPTLDLPQIGAISPLPDLFHRSTATMPFAKENASGGNLAGLPKVPANTLGSDSNAINSPLLKCSQVDIRLMGSGHAYEESDNNLNSQLEPDFHTFSSVFSGTGTSSFEDIWKRYKASGLDTNVLAGARCVSGVWAAQGPMRLVVNTVMARSFERSMEAGTLGMIGHKRFMSDIPSKTSETNLSGFRPLSPHLPLYQPQLSSTLSIFNRIAGAFLAGVILLFYMIYMKLGLVSLTYDSFYQFIFYSSKLNLLVMEISALAVSYHLYSAIRHLFL
ncbi:Succinate dehydrogenase subunit 3-2, mitochondrial [Glycine soja]|uniref:Succinate dehydrogenase subunit 3-2, mitochondrial n=1 Tax=Glycine soja TaxID=3848 RepID=A0A445HNH7_GLYSO|nr:Succinate dehydrogenase subunit 3-2, mitochondrial [Glycine soja]